MSISTPSGPKVYTLGIKKTADNTSDTIAQAAKNTIQSLVTSTETNEILTNISNSMTDRVVANKAAMWKLYVMITEVDAKQFSQIQILTMTIL